MKECNNTLQRLKGWLNIKDSKIHHNSNETVNYMTHRPSNTLISIYFSIRHNINGEQCKGVASSQNIHSVRKIKEKRKKISRFKNSPK